MIIDILGVDKSEVDRMCWVGNEILVVFKRRKLIPYENVPFCYI